MLRVQISSSAPRPHGLVVMTSPFHGDNRGSIPLGGTKVWYNSYIPAHKGGILTYSLERGIKW